MPKWRSNNNRYFKSGKQSVYSGGGVNSHTTTPIPMSEVLDKENARKFDELMAKNKNAKS